MAEPFTVTVLYKGQEDTFNAELRILGYSYKIAVFIGNTELLFEPDEERNYRALLSETDMRSKKIDIELVRLIAEELERNLK